MKLTKADALTMLDRLVDPKGHQSERVAQEELMVRAMAFYVGKQYFEQLGGILYEIPYDNENEVRYRVNFIAPAVERATAKVANIQGQLRVAPPSGSPRHRHGAKNSDRVLSHLVEATSYREQKMIAMKWAAICGSGFLKIGWDPTIGDVRRYYRDRKGKTRVPGSFDEAADFEREGLFEDEYLGDVSVHSVSPFAFHWDWDSRNGIDECAWCAEISYVSASKVAERFNVKEDTLPRGGGVITGPALYDEAIAFMTSGGAHTSYAYEPTQKKDEGRGLLTQLYYRPSEKFPRGLYLVRYEDTMLLVEDNPHRDLPYVKVDWWKMPGRFMGLGLVEHLMVPQYRYNEARSRMTEFQNVFGQPSIFVPNGSGIDPENVVLQPGMIYPYQPGTGAFEYVNPPQLPPEVAANSQIAQGEINTISSQADPDMTGAPGQMRSGPALDAFFKEKNQILSTVQRQSLVSDQKAAIMMLRIAQREYTDDRVIRYVGDDGEFAVMPFKRVDLHSDVRIVGDFQDQDSLIAWKQEVQELIQVGALQPAQNRDHWKLLVNAYRYNTFDQAGQDWARDEANQEKEIQKMLADPNRWVQTPYPIAEYEDDEAHAKVLERFMKSDEFMGLDPISQSVVYAHYQLHKQAIQQAMEQQLAMMEAVKGAPGQKGSPSQPASRG